MNIHQLSVTYQAEPDRILVRVNTTAQQEMRMWLTRRLMANLWPVLTKLLTEHLMALEAAAPSLTQADDGLKKMLADFRKEEFLRAADFDTPYQGGKAALPLGAKPLLVTEVDASPPFNGKVRLTFREKAPEGAKPRSFQMELKPKLMQGLMHLLEQALATSRWREPFSAPALVPETAQSDPGETERPRYLN
ncbi:MAG TPA: hypothetical protein VLJ58_16180 [Ramlibacter sp.]|nr:hypothetical protein [Ramlibacter sp.]